jgi:hypothetical protein
VLDLLLLNTRVHLKFFARNRLILALAFLVLAIAALALLPAALMSTSIGRFDLMRMIVGYLTSVTLFLTSGLGLFAVASHLRGRSLRVVLTKPCPPEVWLGSVFLAGACVIVTLHFLMAAAVGVLSLAWSVPYQTGFAFVAVDGLCRALLWFSYVTALSVALHPVVAALLAVFVQEGTFFGLKFLLASAAKAKGWSWVLAIVGGLVDAVYMVLPMMEPFSQKTEAVYSSLRTVGRDWPVLLQVVGYTALAVAFFYCLSVLMLRRKSLA